MRKKRHCSNHYAMLRECGETRDWKFKWGEGGYAPMHNWLRRNLGPAAEHDCVDCAEPAAEWSYNGGDPNERIDPERGSKFSRLPEFYSPRCVRCHRRFDENPIAVRSRTP